MEFTRSFAGCYDVRIKYQDNTVFFNLLDSAYAAGYARASSLRHHTKGKRRETVIDGVIYLTVKAINKVAKDASKTAGMKTFAIWAKKTADEVVIEANRPKAVVVATPPSRPANGIVEPLRPVKQQSTFDPRSKIATTSFVAPVLIGIKGAAATIGMSVQQLSDWLVSEGYASRYKSNNALYWNAWFKEQGYGKRPIITDHKGQRESNVAKLTKSGFEFVKARLNSQREVGVLSFAAKESNERVKLEAEIDALIKDTFKGVRTQKTYSALLGIFDAEYFMKEDVLIKGVKAILAEVKLKEKHNE